MGINGGLWNVINGSASKEFKPPKKKKLHMVTPRVRSCLTWWWSRGGSELVTGKSYRIGDNQWCYREGANVVVVSHLHFADDAILFCNNNLEQILNIKRILGCFQLLSGLTINFSKSSICGVDIEDLNIWGGRKKSLRLKYLGCLWGQF